ncbi:hypothetical protein DM860_007227 [Cuscuta australis]|uniref:cytokinin riboside 5'-monophosphate phosphoribohydrolase n=1 Tax=Cuscuta australis TaxID=267555 RepID=A0A328E4E1_9ASTE|nr:hypothetical protein DM860_007227 [Cuscuta australis]
MENRRNECLLNRSRRPSNVPSYPSMERKLLEREEKIRQPSQRCEESPIAGHDLGRNPKFMATAVDLGRELVYGPTYGAQYTVSNNYYMYFEMNHVVEAFIILPGGIDTMEGLFTLISWASEGLHSKPIGLLNIDGYFNNLIKFLDDANVDLFLSEQVDFGQKLTYGGGNVGLQGAVASTLYTNGGIVRGFIPGYIATRQVYGPTYGAQYTVSSNYYMYFEMNHVVEAFIIFPGGIDTMEGLFTLISRASEGLHSKPIGLLNIDGYFNNLIKFLDDAVRQNFMASSQRKLFISSFFIDELLHKLAFAKAFLGSRASYNEFVNPGALDLELHL